MSFNFFDLFCYSHNLNGISLQDFAPIERRRAGREKIKEVSPYIRIYSEFINLILIYCTLGL